MSTSQLKAVQEEVAHTIRNDTAARHTGKYTNRNPIHRLTLGRFFARLAEVLKGVGGVDQERSAVFEFGCGEGLLLRELKNRGFKCGELIGIDLRANALAQARDLHPEWRFECVDLFKWSPPKPKFDVVIASQVLEHIPNPRPILEKLVAMTGGTLVLTVPKEPWFQIMNLLRGRDLLRLGNHPEHVNRWSTAQFAKFVSEFATIERVESVFPFTIVVAKPK
jgi:2-polyprenyl-3-methyl-5-hydroxy-6-metoxy-1,4-benzoquinol methylase